MAVDYRAMAAREARRYGLDPHIFIRQIKQESGFNPNARSPAGATGIAQIMPDTARAWGVNPNDPKAALRAAAKNMAQYVKKYGSYENALRAYNAGPGAIEKSKGYSETNHYVQTILRGRDPKRLGSRRGGGGSEGGGREGSPGFGIPGTPLSQEYTPGAERVLSDVGGDNSGLLQALIGQQAAPPPISGPPRLAVSAQSLMPEGYIPPAGGAAPVQRPDIGALIEATRGMDGGGIDRAAPGSLEVTPGTEGQWVPGSPGEGGSRGSQGGSGGKKPPGRLLEMFHDPGISMDSGKKVAPIGGHGKHVHVAIDSPKGLQAASQLAKQMGLTITSTTGGKHAPGSWHYRGKAIDVGGDPKKLREYNRKIARLYG